MLQVWDTVPMVDMMNPSPIKMDTFVRDGEIVLIWDGTIIIYPDFYGSNEGGRDDQEK